jgi:hypothetical protein
LILQFAFLIAALLNNLDLRLSVAARVSGFAVLLFELGGLVRQG